MNTCERGAVYITGPLTAPVLSNNTHCAAAESSYLYLRDKLILIPDACGNVIFGFFFCFYFEVNDLIFFFLIIGVITRYR